jgi:hypothetical protein
MKNSLLSFFLLILLVSCKDETAKKTPLQAETKIVQSINTPATTQASLSRLYSNNKQLFLSWVEKKDTISELKFAVYDTNKWSEPSTITAGNNWFVNWADFPAIAENNGNILTHTLQKSASGTYTYDIKLNLYNASTKSWKKDFLLNNDGTQSEHGFVSMVPDSSNGFFVTWLDGRNTVNSKTPQMTLRGATVTPNGEIVADTLLDNRTCDCCNTAATLTNNGPIVVYRDRSKDEIRDIYIVRKVAGKWTAPKPVFEDNWYIPGCPVNGPAIDATKNNVSIAWFTAADDNPRVQVAFSDNAGETFGMPIRVDNGNAIGRVDIVSLDASNAAVLWMEPKGNETLIQLAKVSNSGKVNTPITISKTLNERASGFPQVEKVGQFLFISWTSLGEAQSIIKMAKVSVNDL